MNDFHIKLKYTKYLNGKCNVTVQDSEEIVSITVLQTGVESLQGLIYINNYLAKLDNFFWNKDCTIQRFDYVEYKISPTTKLKDLLKDKLK